LLWHVPGKDTAKVTRPPLLVHGHLDTVPADAAEWSRDPWCGDILDGELWGRGAVDMKDMDAMMIAFCLDVAAGGKPPSRDITMCLFADEEANGRLGAHWWVDKKPELFRGHQAAIGELGGYSVDVAGKRAYLLQTAEKGLSWVRLTAHGVGGHGSAKNPDNAVVKVADAVGRVGALTWPAVAGDAMGRLLTGLGELAGSPWEGPAGELDDAAAARALELIGTLGPAQRFVAPSLGTSVNVTGLQAGGKVNVVPAQASATVDARPLPGTNEQVLGRIREAAGPDVDVEVMADDIGVEAPADGPIANMIRSTLGRADPDAVVLPYMCAAGTDAKALARVDVPSYGFVPLRLPAGFDFTAMYHGVDERVPVASLEFGAETLAEFLRHC
jgi:acetylornithine deacetylase/succinyl-diaminopimelate desuccinylase-like protein